jgi:hypothetical protein
MENSHAIYYGHCIFRVTKLEMSSFNKDHMLLKA